MTEEKKQEILNNHSEERTKCQRWTRVMGYYRPIESHNQSKKQEERERVYFETKSSCADC